MLAVAAFVFGFDIAGFIARAAKINKVRARLLESARVSRAGFGVAPKQSFPVMLDFSNRNELRKSPRSRGRARQHARRVRSPKFTPASDDDRSRGCGTCILPACASARFSKSRRRFSLR